MLVQYAYAIDLVFCLDWFFLANENIETPLLRGKEFNFEELHLCVTYTHQVFVPYVSDLTKALHPLIMLSLL